MQYNVSRKKPSSCDPSGLQDNASAPTESRRREAKRRPPSESIAAGGQVKIELGPGDAAVLKRILESLEDGSSGATHALDDGSEKLVAEIMFEARRDRARLFPPSMFSEPAWDMLLALYIANEVTVAADLARRTATPITTAMRWIQYLESHRLIVRESCSADRRSHTIRLTEQARTNMRIVLSEMVEKWRWP